MNKEEKEKHEEMKNYFAKFINKERDDLKNQVKQFRFFPKGGYEPFYRGEEIIRILQNIEDNVLEGFNDLGIPQTFTSFEKLVKDLKLFYKYLQDTEEIFQDVFSTFNPKNNYNDILSKVYETKNKFQDVFRVLIDLSNGITPTLKTFNLDIKKPPKQQYDILILTAIYEEYKAVKDILVDGIDLTFSDTDDSTKTIYYKSTLDVIYNGVKRKFTVLLVCANQMGLTSAAFLTTKLISLYNPKIVTMCGIAAGIKGELGDVMIPDILWDYGSGKNELIKKKKKDKEKFTQYRFPINVNQNLIGEIIRITKESDISSSVYSSGEGIDFPNKAGNLKAHIGPFVSGSSVMANDKKKEDIKKQDGKLIGFDMEAYAVAYCSHFAFTKPFFFIVKSISDYGDKNKADKNKELHQKYAAYTSAKYLIELITHYPELFGLLEEENNK